MSKNTSIKIGLALVLIVGVCLAVLITRPNGSLNADDDQTKGVVAIKKGDDGRKATVRRTSKDGRKGEKSQSRKPTAAKAQAKAKPSLVLDGDEDENITEEIKRIREELQSALDDNDEQKVIAAVRKLKSSGDWPDRVPRSVKMAAIEALSWFGVGGMATSASFLADSDPEVVQTAVDKFEEMLSNLNMGDRAMSSVLVELAGIVQDRDALDSFFMKMNEMRNSVKVETALAILDSGNAEAVAVLKDNLDFLFNDGEDEVKTREDIVKYGQDNPDGEDDEEFYGPQTDDE